MSRLLCFPVCDGCLKVVGQMASHQGFPHRNPEDCSQQIRTEFLLVKDQGPVDSGASDIGSILGQLDMSQPLHYPAERSNYNDDKAERSAFDPQS